MHMPMMSAHQANQHTPMDYYAPYPVTRMPPRMQAGPISDEDEFQKSPTFRMGAGSKRLRQEDTPGGHQRFRTTQRQSHRPTLNFDEDVFNTQNTDKTVNGINGALDRLERLVNDATLENISQSVKDRIQALANRLNGNDINKTLGKITEVLEKLTAQQENTQIATTQKDPTLETTPPQKQTFAKVVASKKTTTRVPTAEEPPSLRHHPRRVIVLMEEKPPVHARPPANKVVNTINTKLQELGARFKTQSASWTDAGNLVLIVPTPDDANNMVAQFDRWSTSLPMKASLAQLDTKTHQVVIQRAYIRNDHDKPMTPAEIADELYSSNNIERKMLALPPRILVARNTLDNVEHGPIMVSFRNEADAIHYKTFGVFFRGGHCYVRDYVETRRINRCLNCHELTHPTRSCSRKPRCVHCSSSEHLSAEHPEHECKECEEDEACPHNNLKCINCNGNHASNNPGCPVWMKRRGLLKDAGPTRQRQPPGGRTSHTAKLADIAKPARASKKQNKKKETTPIQQDNELYDEEGELEMESDG